MVDAIMGINVNVPTVGGQEKTDGLADRAASDSGSAQKAKSMSMRPSLFVTDGEVNRAASLERKLRPEARKLEESLHPTAASQTMDDYVRNANGVVKIDA